MLYCEYWTRIVTEVVAIDKTDPERGILTNVGHLGLIFLSFRENEEHLDPLVTYLRVRGLHPKLICLDGDDAMLNRLQERFGGGDAGDLPPICRRRPS
eukprot:gene12324-biopygen16285